MIEKMKLRVRALRFRRCILTIFGKRVVHVKACEAMVCMISMS